jgi:hypothetical protein
VDKEPGLSVVLPVAEDDKEAGTANTSNQSQKQ